MRPYRGLTKDGKWVYGNLIVNNAYDLNDGTHKPEPMHTYIRERDYTWVNDPNNKRWTHISYEVIPETVSEQIGLPDKNGVEAYENDEIKFLTISGGIGKGVIEYEAPIYFVRMKTGARYEFSEFSDFEVIGSIHQEAK